MGEKTHAPTDLVLTLREKFTTYGVAFGCLDFRAFAKISMNSRESYSGLHTINVGTGCKRKNPIHLFPLG